MRIAHAIFRDDLITVSFPQCMRPCPAVDIRVLNESPVPRTTLCLNRPLAIAFAVQGPRARSEAPALSSARPSPMRQNAQVIRSDPANAGEDL